MNKTILFSLLVLFNTIFAMEKKDNSIQHVGEFAVDLYQPCYAGYSECNKLCNPATRCSYDWNRKVFPNELLFKIVTACGLISTNEEIQGEAEVNWDSLSIPNYMPYKELSALKEGSIVCVSTPRTKQIVQLTVNTKKFADNNDTIENRITNLLKKIKTSPNFFLENEEQLVKDKIITPQENKKDTYTHGPNGFDFSILDKKQ